MRQASPKEQYFQKYPVLAASFNDICSMSKNNHLFFKKDSGDGPAKYMRVITTGNKINYVEVTMQGKKTLDYNEKDIDNAARFVESLLAEPGVAALPPIVFNLKTGIPLK